MHDNFLVQHVTSPTRKNAILDLIVTDEPDMITDLTDLGPLATSDHKALQWSMQIRTLSTSRTRQVFEYTKADTPAILKELAADSE